MAKYVDNTKEITELIHQLQCIENRIDNHTHTSDSLHDMIERIEEIFHEYQTLKTAMDQAIIVAITNKAGQIVHVNEKFCEISKYSREEMIGKTHRLINSGYHDKNFFKEMWATIKLGKVWEGNIKNKAKDGTFYWVKTSIVPICSQDQKPHLFVALRTDITKWKEKEERLLNAVKNDFNFIVSSLSNVFFKVGKNDVGEFIYLLGEGKLSEQLAFQTENIYGKSPGQIFSSELTQRLEHYYEQAYHGETITYDYTIRNFHFITTLSPVYEDGRVVNLIGCSNDVTELHHAKNEAEFLAYHDWLTELPNRRKCTEDINKLMKQGKLFATFIIDINRYKVINGSLGHTFADELVQHVANRLKQVLTVKDSLYKFSEDEFVIIHQEYGNRQSLLSFSRAILDAFKEKFQLKRMIELYITSNIGISLYPDHGTDIETLIKNADSALSVSKKLGKNAYKIYDQEMNREMQKYIELETYLRTAIQNDEFTLYFQPKLNIKANKINSMEALLRWQHPVLGSVSPSIFIPIAEETGIIWQIDEWVLQKACEQTKKWNEGNQASLRVAVNISAMHFCHPDFVDMVKNKLQRTNLSPTLLELEITETTIINSPEECIDNVEKLRKLGVMVSIDDFGTGFTSLSYLRRIPFDYLKIDRSYVKEMLQRKEDRAIIKTIIMLAHELQLKVIAEGVEEREILEQLKQFGCDEIQGYYISRPLSIVDFERDLRNQKGLPLI